MTMLIDGKEVTYVFYQGAQYRLDSVTQTTATIRPLHGLQKTVRRSLVTYNGKSLDACEVVRKVDQGTSTKPKRYATAERPFGRPYNEAVRRRS